MRKIIVALIALAAIAASAQPAAADAPHTLNTWSQGKFTGRSCTTVWQYGVYGAYGAWGAFIDGCLVSRQCPQDARSCVAYQRSHIETQEQTGNRVTLNSRLSTYAGYKVVHQDQSCSGANKCNVMAGGLTMRATDFANVVCNGVRDYDIPDGQQTLGRVVCEVFLHVTY